MQRSGRLLQRDTPSTKTPHGPETEAAEQEQVIQQAMNGAGPSVTSPRVVQVLGRLVGNRATRQIMQRALGISTGAPPTIQRDTADDIGNGHSYDKHVVTKGEFPGVTSKPQFITIVKDVMTTATQTRNLSGGRIAYWKGDTVVIYNPSAGDKGTCFKPTLGKTYFDNLT